VTKRQLKIGAIIAGAGFAVWWFFFRGKTASKPAVVGPTGDVILGTPTVTGGAATSGGTDYNTKPTVDAVS
jgi:hypothetical protein